jgi:hypothetical protein
MRRGFAPERQKRWGVGRRCGETAAGVVTSDFIPSQDKPQSMRSDRLWSALAIALAALVLFGGFQVAWPLVGGCGGPDLAIELAGEVTVESDPGTTEPGTVTVTFVEDGRTHPLHPCDAHGGDVPFDRVRVEWTAEDGVVTVAEGTPRMTEEGSAVVLRERTAATDSVASVRILATSTEGDEFVIYDENVTL